MEELIEILVVEHDEANMVAALKASPDGTILTFTGSFEEAMEEIEKTYSTYYGAIFEQHIPNEGRIVGCGHLPMLEAMSKRIPSLLFTEKKRWGKARIYDDPLHYAISHDRYVLETTHKSEEAAWREVFNYLLDHKEELEEM